MASYKIRILSCSGGTQEIMCPDDKYILDAAEEAGIDLPYSCRAGACSTCACRVIFGSYDDSDQSFLDGTQRGTFILSCTTYPTSDMTIMSHAEADLVE